MSSHHVPKLLVAAALLALPLHAMPQSDRPEQRLIEKYDSFAGSEQNAQRLVEGLRDDSRIQISKGGKTTSFTSPTGKMGYGNVDISLALAQASLAEQGIRSPTPEQIRAALVGGTVTNKAGKRVELEGVLQQRADGMGWGKIAQENGFKLGEVMRADRHDKRDDAERKRHGGDSKHGKPERTHVSRLDKADRPDKHDGPEKFERANRPEKFERVSRPEKIERPDKIEHPEKFERPQRPERHGRH